MNKFQIGQKVLSSDGQEHEVLSFSFDSENGYLYKVTAKEVDMVKKEIIYGISHYKEGELIEIKDVK